MANSCFNYLAFKIFPPKLKCTPLPLLARLLCMIGVYLNNSRTTSIKAMQTPLCLMLVNLICKHGGVGIHADSNSQSSALPFLQHYAYHPLQPHHLPMLLQQHRQKEYLHWERMSSICCRCLMLVRFVTILISIVNYCTMA
jgi:hypothetical protein